MGAQPTAELMEDPGQHRRVGELPGFTELYRRVGRSLFGTDSISLAAEGLMNSL